MGSRGLFVSKKQEEGKELKVRLVADFKDVNMVLKSPNYPNEGSESLLKQIDPEAQVFCTLDFSHGYYQVEIDKRDRDLFSFLVPQGKYRFCRLAQGSKPASNLFNIIIDDEIRSIDEEKKNMDDISLAQRNYNLLDPVIDKLLKICWKKNLKLNPSKFKIGNQVDFGGTRLRFSKANNRVQISPSQQKIEELMGKEPPKTKKQLQSVLGSLNQLATWMPQIKSHIPLMRKLSGGNNQFKESEQLNQEFELMKNQLKKTVTLSPLEVGRELHLHTDASNNGLGFILSQPHKDEKKKDYENYNITRNIVTLGSAGLSDTQQRYSACEQECLAVLHAIQKVDHFVRGAPEIKVFTDNKNIRDYFNMGLADIRNQRILNFREKLLGYPLTFILVKGSTHSLADHLSRFPEEGNTCTELEDRFVPSICSKSLRTLQVNENPKNN